MDPAGPKTADAETARLIVRPPWLFLAALIIAHLLDHLLNLPFPFQQLNLVHWITGSVLIVIGLSLMVMGIRNFGAAGTPVPSVQPTVVLVTTGIHGRTRNPIYIGMFLVYGGIGIAASSPWTLIIALPLAITIRFGVVAREEAYLERRFGATYSEYKARVRRWL